MDSTVSEMREIDREFEEQTFKGMGKSMDASEELDRFHAYTRSISDKIVNDDDIKFITLNRKPSLRFNREDLVRIPIPSGFDPTDAVHFNQAIGSVKRLDDDDETDDNEDFSFDIETTSANDGHGSRLITHAVPVVNKRSVLKTRHIDFDPSFCVNDKLHLLSSSQIQTLHKKFFLSSCATKSEGIKKLRDVSVLVKDLDDKMKETLRKRE